MVPTVVPNEQLEHMNRQDYLVDIVEKTHTQATRNVPILKRSYLACGHQVAPQ